MKCAVAGWRFKVSWIFHLATRLSDTALAMSAPAAPPLPPVPDAAAGANSDDNDASSQRLGELIYLTSEAADPFHCDLTRYTGITFYLGSLTTSRTASLSPAHKFHTIG